MTTTTAKPHTVTATTESGETVRLSLPAPVWEGSDKYSTGVTLEAVYVSPRARRCVIQTYSIWQNSAGSHTGTKYHLVEDMDQLNRLAGEYPDVAAALESAGIIAAEEL